MYRVFALFLVSCLTVEASGNGTKCNGFNANFDLQKIIGTWYVVAIFPEAIFPDKQKIPCYEVEFSEIEESGLRWLMNQTHAAPHPKVFEDNKGITIRQRYNSDHPFDVWSKSLDGANGCFQQVLSLNTDWSDIKRALSNEARMQLHLIETGRESGPFLLQMLWGNLITGVIYQKNQAIITPDKLKPVSDVMVKLRGPQRAPKICDKRLKD